jgi:hypothetical protein
MSDTGGKYRRNQQEDVEYMPKNTDMKELESENRRAEPAGRKKSEFVEKRPGNAKE